MKIDTKLFLLRLRMSLNAKSNVELAKILDVPYSTLNTWLTRNSLPVETIIGKSVCDNISVDWLLAKEDHELFRFSEFPTLIAAIEIATTTEEGMLRFNVLLETFIIEEIIQKLLNKYAVSKSKMTNNFSTRIKRLLFNVTEGRFLMLLDEMLGKINLTKSDNAHDKIQELISGDFLHPLLSKPAFKESEKMAFQAWAEDLSAEEAEFLVINSVKIHESLKTLIPKISKRNSAFDVAVMKKITG
ncbi:MAG: helix-turn-helix domain-containing protein [Flavobacterium sp.]|nr:helix-turn-helix domain-containing protein [Flavobacterium sp.]